MADPKTAKTIVQLDGEKEYNAALDAAYSKLRVLRSELKAETAELGANATAQQKATAKQKSLKDQIQQQEQIVKTLTKQLAEVRDKYADNEEVQDKYETKLNKAREALAKMKTELESTNQVLSGNARGFEAARNSASNTATAVFSINDAMKTLGGIASSIGSDISGAFSAALATVQEIAEAITALLTEAWASADDWQTIAAIYGGSASDVQKLFNTAARAGFGAGDLSNSIQKLVARTHNGAKEFNAAMAELELVTGQDLTEDNYDSHIAYFDAVLNALSSIGDEAQRLKLAEDLFGDKAGAGFAGFIADYQAAAQRTEDSASRGLLLTDDEIANMSEAQKLVNSFKTDWDEIRSKAAANLTIRLKLTDLMNNAEVAFKDLAQVFLADTPEKRAEAIVSLDSSLTAFMGSLSDTFKSLQEMLTTTGTELSESDNPFLKALGNLMITMSGIMEKAKDAILDLVNWLNEEDGNGESNLTKVLNYLVTDWTVKLFTGKTIGGWFEAVISKIGEIWLLIQGLKWLKGDGNSILNKLFGGGNSGSAGTGTGTGTGNAVPSGDGTGGTSAWNWVKNKGSSLWDGAKAALPALVETVLPAVGETAILAGATYGFLKLNEQKAKEYNTKINNDDTFAAQEYATWLAHRTDVQEGTISKEDIINIVQGWAEYEGNGLMYKGTGFNNASALDAFVEKVIAQLEADGYNVRYHEDPNPNPIYGDVDTSWKTFGDMLRNNLHVTTLAEDGAASYPVLKQRIDRMYEAFGSATPLGFGYQSAFGEIPLTQSYADVLMQTLKNVSGEAWGAEMSPAEMVEKIMTTVSSALFEDELSIDRIYRDLVTSTAFQQFGAYGEYDAYQAHGYADAVAAILEGYGFDVKGFDFSSYAQEYENLHNRVNGMPDEISSAVRSNLIGLKVSMDGETVGSIVAPYVSTNIAGMIVGQ